GDPIEVGAIGSVLAESDNTHWLGSVKSTFGHTEGAAGIAGVIKAALCLEHGLIPPNLHFESPNPRIPFDTLPLRVPTELVAFPAYAGPRRAGVNSFGFGGTNAHAILEQAPEVGDQLVDDSNLEATDGGERGPCLLTLSARSPQALAALGEAYATLLTDPDGLSLRRISRAAALNREHHRLRVSVVAEDAAQAADKLQGLEFTPIHTSGTGIAFVYSGMGPQWWGMGRELLLHEPVFAAVVEECDSFLKCFEVSIGTELTRPEDESRLTTTLLAQVANFVVQAGLTEIWRSWGIEPAAIVGHSVGEIAAAYAAGVYTLTDALTISFHRAALQSRLAGRGAMAAVGLAAADVEPHLIDNVDIAAVNSHSATTISGDPRAVEVVCEGLRSAGASVRPLRVEVGYHSYQMSEIREPLLASLHDIRPRRAGVPLYSTVTGERVAGPELDSTYWWRNVRERVRFGTAFGHLLSHGLRAVLEIGPHPVLASAMDEIMTERDSPTIRLASLHRDRPQRQHLLETLGALYCTGMTPDWRGVHSDAREHPWLPRYPWQREYHWIEPEETLRARVDPDRLRLAGRPVTATEPTTDIELSSTQLPYLPDHRIRDTVVFPGTGYLEAALALFPHDEPCFLENVIFHRPLALRAPTITTLRLGYDPNQRQVRMHSTDTADTSVWTLHTELRRADPIRPRIPAPMTRTLAELTRSLPAFEHDELYATLGRSGLNYGPAFRAIDQLWLNAQTSEVFAQLRLDTVDTRRHRLHPAVFDAALHAFVAGALLTADPGPAATYVPASIEEFRFYRSPGLTLWVYGKGRASSGVECDITLITDGGEIVAELIGVHAQGLAADKDHTEPDETDDLYYEHLWRPTPLGHTGDANGTWIIVNSTPGWEGLIRALSDRGGEVRRVDPQQPDWLHTITTEIESQCRGILFICQTDPIATQSIGAAPSSAPACASVVDPLCLFQAILATGRMVPLSVVTHRAQSVSDTDATTDPFGAAVWGLGRVVNAEWPEFRFRLIDVDCDAPTANLPVVESIITEVTSAETDEVALRRDQRYIRRFSRADGRSVLRRASTRTDRTPVSLVTQGTGITEVGFAGTTRRAPGPQEVEIEVAYAGLNFKDVLKVTGLLSSEALEGSYSQETFGMECSGTVVRTGARVRDLRIGDEVFAHGRDLFRSHATLDAIRVVPKPAKLSLAQTASLFPVATAYQTLVRLAGIRRGERILVHSAAGGVGLAAVRIAVRLGCEVYATAGNASKRQFLLKEGVAHVADSRSTTFADDIRRWTGGEGVDVVLNSLAGAMFGKSLELLRPFGRFIELGKTEIAADRAVRMAPFLRGLSFHAFDYDAMMLQRPESVREIMQELAVLYDSGELEPLPITEVSAAHVSDAFGMMARGEHIGKVVVHMSNEPVPVPTSSIHASPIHADGTYVLTGGLGGLGLEVAQWLVHRGARHLVLIGRRGIATPEAEQVVMKLSELGAEVRVEQADVSLRKQVSTVLSRVRAHMPPIRGVIHMAASFDDADVAEIDADHLIAASRAKADGAWHLHTETAADDLDIFVLFSSVSAQTGPIHSVAYVTANEFLNGLARYRRTHALPAISVGWGMVDEVGVAVSGDGTVAAVLRGIGNVAMTPTRLLTELGNLMHAQPIEASVAGMDWHRWATANPKLARYSRFQELIPSSAETTDPSASVSQRLYEATGQARLDLLTENLIPLLHKATGLSVEQLENQDAVDIDSLLAVELRISMQNSLGISVPAVKMQRNLTLSTLSALLVDELERIPTASGSIQDITAHEFTSSDGLTVYGHLSLPARPAPHPAVVVCTSGNGGALDDDGHPTRTSEHGPLNRAGFAVFTVDHRGTPGHGADFSARAELGGREIDDVVAAARYLTDLPEIDESRINILGTSRGAYCALSAMLRAPSIWHRGALLMGFYNPTRLIDAERSHPGTIPALPAGKDPSELEEYFAEPHRRPLDLLHSLTAPVLLVHGEADSVIPTNETVQLADRAHELDLPANLITVTGLGHDDEHSSDHWTELWPEITQFLDQPATSPTEDDFES
ncbi:MAG: SDR family NAD(P)-dependent oxidoreductase, partial [Mycobacterium sp.]|nr:SDR family NAD(P)-dependent oxidoreductase [Mycobacterium sp.]